MANYNITEFPIVATPIGDTVQQTEVDSVLALKNNEIAKVSVDDLKEQMHVTSTAEEVSYDNTNSGLSAENVQSAIDETTRNANATERSLKALWKVSEGQIYDTETVTDEAYQRTVPSGGFYADVRKIGGKTVVWNQQMYGLSSDNWKTSNAQTSFSDGVLTMTATSRYGGISPKSDTQKNVLVSGHIYYRAMSIKPTTENTTVRINWQLDGAWASLSMTANNVGAWNYKEDIVVCNVSGIANQSLQDTRTSGWDEIQVKDIFLVDLTQMYGSGNEPSTLTDERILAIKSYLESHPEYNSGELVSADVDKVVSEKSDHTVLGESLIPSALRTEHPLRSAGTVHDEYDFERMKFVQRVGYLELAVDNMNNTEDYPGWRNSGIVDIVGDEMSGTEQGALFEFGTVLSYNTKGTNDILFLGTGWYHLTQTEFKTQYAGETFHFAIQMAEPIETDISSYFAESDPLWNVLDVEGGGTLTMHQTETEIPVPNEIQYGINLSEVGA